MKCITVYSTWYFHSQKSTLMWKLCLSSSSAKAFKEYSNEVRNILWERPIGSLLNKATIPKFKGSRVAKE